MTKIVNFHKIEELTHTLHQTKQRIVVVGGCFDLLHPGHLLFLEKAKNQGETLVVLLESDETVQRQKGKDRPFFTQAERAYMLSQLQSVDFVILLQGARKHQE